MTAKWKNFGNGVLYIMGALILVLQGYKLVKYYIFHSEVKMDSHDLILAVLAIGVMFLQSTVKDKVKSIISTAIPFKRKSTGDNQ